MKLAIGVMGSSDDRQSETVLAQLRALGGAIARHDCVLITGGCPGMPYAAVQGAKQAGGLVIGISPGLSLDEHAHKYESPIYGFDVMIYTGSGLMGR
jgi:hypothetical protein